MSHPDSITVTGTGSVIAVPDVAILRLGSEVRSQRLKDAYDGASHASEAIVAAALRAGVARNDIASTSLTVTPEMTWEEGRGQRLVGYAAGRGLTVRARDIAHTGDLLDAVVTAGGDAVRINGLALGIADESSAHASALEAAFLDAKASAERLAELAGRGLGAVVRIEVGPAGGMLGQPVPLRRVAFAAAEASAPLEVGETEVSASLIVAWELT